MQVGTFFSVPTKCDKLYDLALFQCLTRLWMQIGGNKVNEQENDLTLFSKIKLPK